MIDETTVRQDDSSAGRRPFHVGTHEDFKFETCRESKSGLFYVYVKSRESNFSKRSTISPDPFNGYTPNYKNVSRHALGVYDNQCAK